MPSWYASLFSNPSPQCTRPNAHRNDHLFQGRSCEEMKGNSLAQIRKKEIPMAKHPASRQRNIESDMRYTLSRSTMKGGDVIVENKVEHENGTNCNSSELEETNDNPALKERTKDVTFVSEEKSVAMKRKFKENIQDKSVSSDHNHSCKRFCKSGKEKSTELSLKDAADKSQLVVANGNGIKGALSQNVSGKSSDINSNKKSIELVLKKKENDGRLQGFPEKEIIEEYKNQTKQLLQMAKNGCCAKSQLGLKKGYFCKYLLGLFKVIDVFLNERLTLISKAMEGITESNKITLTENFKAILQNEWKIGSLAHSRHRFFLKIRPLYWKSDKENSATLHMLRMQERGIAVANVLFQPFWLKARWR
mmetsp:Transcript_5356/g.8293  ORF Transcript_5356/g.8293 Transcript_5356/m.8293 type:complete len:363 (-) Transcript_5356:683-1771(-)